MTIEVFKTNVNDKGHANLLVEYIQVTFNDCNASFDLEDCDRILRVKNSVGIVPSFRLIDLLKDAGFEAEILS